MATRGKTQLGTESMARTMVRMEAKVAVPVVQVVEVADAIPRVMALVVSQDGIISKQPGMEVEAAVNMAVPVERVMKITKVIMTVVGPNEHVETDRIQVNHAVGAKNKQGAC